MHTAMHAAGWACLLVILALAIWAMVEVVAPQWRRILHLAAGNIEPSFAPLDRMSSAFSEVGGRS